jgi:hypothetical protein
MGVTKGLRGSMAAVRLFFATFTVDFLSQHISAKKKARIFEPVCTSLFF